MKRMSQILYSLSLFTLMILTSCGSDDKTSTGASVSSFNGECSFTSEYSPVCGVNNITYDNISIAQCYQVTYTTPGNCICSARLVCGDNGVTYEECDAQAAFRFGIIKKIVKYSSCN